MRHPTRARPPWNELSRFCKKIYLFENLHLESVLGMFSRRRAINSHRVFVAEPDERATIVGPQRIERRQQLGLSKRMRGYLPRAVGTKEDQREYVRVLTFPNSKSRTRSNRWRCCCSRTSSSSSSSRNDIMLVCVPLTDPRYICTHTQRSSFSSHSPVNTSTRIMMM